ncbi:phosphoglycerate kinase [Spiroplasma endosymbiont of Anurida maritima]|uniref:phosphoglycerate kinase n=1 Tax=Spiroplasma endosymbiont of Anurida maritima TaxID=2967972 RepID=UPI0036D2740D
MTKKTLKDINVKGKKVLVRVDFNVPMKNGKITDNNRIVGAWDTIKYLQDNDAKIILFSHLGKIKVESDMEKNCLMPVSEELQKFSKAPVHFSHYMQGPVLEQQIADLKEKEILVVQNTRFADIFDKDSKVIVDAKGNAAAKRESKNDPELGKYWASFGDVFVNDAFGTAHRAHASNVGIASNIKESCVGFLVEKELNMLSKAMNNPKRPLVAIVGGAKVSDKINVIENLLKIADKVIIGGGMAFTFYKAMGFEIGKSLLEEDKVDVAKDLIKKGQDKLVLPIDAVETTDFKDVKGDNTKDRNVSPNKMGLDIGQKSIELFNNVIKNAKTVVWNGPMGVFEFENYNKGTIAVCETIANLKDAFTVIGGGDSAAAAIKFGFKDKFTHISTGGGASLTFIEGKALPGVDAISNK